jgi:hypothetical protein
MDRSQLYTHARTHTLKPVQQLKQAVISADSFFHTHTNMPSLSTHRNVLFSFHLSTHIHTTSTLFNIQPPSTCSQDRPMCTSKHQNSHSSCTLVLLYPHIINFKMGFNNCSSSVQCDLFLCPRANCARHSFFLESPCSHLAAPGPHTLSTGMD